MHKIVLGILPLDLELELQKPSIRAQVNLPDCRDRTPLHWATIRGDEYAVKNLLLAGADANCQAHGKDTPLHLAAVSQNPRVYKHLITAGADVNFVNLWGDKALNCACNHKDIVACVNLLIDSGADLDHRNKLGATPLIDAAKKNNLEIASLLLDSQANLHIADVRGETPLFQAIFGGNCEFLALLLQNGDDGMDVTINGSTVLHHTAQHGDIKTASILASARLGRIDPDAKDFKGRTAMQLLKQRLVMEEGFEEAFEKLLESIREADFTDSEGSEVYFSDSENYE